MHPEWCAAPLGSSGELTKSEWVGDVRSCACASLPPGLLFRLLTPRLGRQWCFDTQLADLTRCDQEWGTRGHTVRDELLLNANLCERCSQVSTGELSEVQERQVLLRVNEQQVIDDAHFLNIS